MEILKYVICGKVIWNHQNDKLIVQVLVKFVSLAINVDITCVKSSQPKTSALTEN